MYALQFWGVIYVMIAVVLTTIIYKNGPKDNELFTPFLSGFGVAVMATLLAFLVVMGVSLSRDNKIQRWEIVEKHDLAALTTREGWGVQGAYSQLFLFGGGSISGGSDMVYRYAVKTPFGKEIKEVKTGTARIVIDDSLGSNQTPTVLLMRQRSKSVPKDKILRYIVPPEGWDSGYQTDLYQFRIPKGSLETTIAVKL